LNFRQHYPILYASTGHANFEAQPKERSMAQATLKNQSTIIGNQKVIIRNQEKILRNQEAILRNQKKILSNQGRILKK
jgi:hypothetical protein